MPNLDETLSKIIFTRKDVADFEAFLSDLLARSFSLQQNGEIPGKYKQLNIPLSDGEALRKFVDECRLYVKRLGDVRVGLSFGWDKPDTGLNLAQFFRSLGLKDYVVDIQYMPEINGGLTFDINGKYYDLSLNKYIKDRVYEI